MAKKTKTFSRAELERMLYEITGPSEYDDYAAVEGLEEWFQAESDRRRKKREAARERALAKLTDEEREALGFPVEIDDEDFEEDEEDCEDNY